MNHGANGAVLLFGPRSKARRSTACWSGRAAKFPRTSLRSRGRVAHPWRGRKAKEQIGPVGLKFAEPTNEEAVRRPVRVAITKRRRTRLGKEYAVGGSSGIVRRCPDTCSSFAAT
jgi:hypothetical protein